MTFQKWHLITIMAFRRTEKTFDRPMPRGARMGTYTQGAVEVVKRDGTGITLNEALHAN